MSFLENKVYSLNGPFSLEIESVPLDTTSLAENQVMGETVYSCVSPGTELAAYQGLPPLRPGKQYPRLMGYCNVARVIKAGGNVENAEIGDLILTFSSHRKYFQCTSEDIIAVIPHDLDPKLACTVYLYHLGYMALLESGARPGMKIGVVGTGTLGYCTAVLAKAFGFQVSVFSNQHYLQTDFSQQFIPFYSKNLPDHSSTKNSLDVVINTSNSWNDWFLALELLRKKGTMVNLGFPGRGQAMPETNPLDSRYFYDKQLTLKTAGYVYEGRSEPWDIQHNLKRNIAFLLQLIAENKINPSHLISREVSWSQLKDLYDFLLEREEKKFTGILKWQTEDV